MGVREFMAALHARAAHAFEGAIEPGLLQLVAIHPIGTAPICLRFAIGDADQMVEAAIDNAAAGFNVFVEARTVSKFAVGRGHPPTHAGCLPS
jgi:hypothetical protein